MHQQTRPAPRRVPTRIVQQERSTETLCNPNNLVNASRTVRCSKPYRLSSTQAVSSRTVFEIQICPESKSARAAACCGGSSPVSRWTSTLVSTAVMPPSHLFGNRSPRLAGRASLALRAEAPGDGFHVGMGEQGGRTKKDSVLRGFNDELRTWLPCPRVPDAFGQDDLPLA